MTAERWGRIAGMAVWMWATWLLLTWTVTIEQLVYGAVFALCLAVPLASLGPVARPWKLLAPGRVVAGVALLCVYVWRMVGANASLARRIWSPRRPLRSGMVVVADPSTTPGSSAALGLITSTVVDNQLVDVDPDGLPRLMQYHAVWVTSEDPTRNAAQIFGSLPRWIERVRSGGRR